MVRLKDSLLHQSTLTSGMLVMFSQLLTTLETPFKVLLSQKLLAN